MDAQVLLQAAKDHRAFYRREPSTYRRHFKNAEYFAAFKLSDEWIIEPIGWLLRFLDEDGANQTKAVTATASRKAAVAAGGVFVKRGDSDFEELWQATKDWAVARKIGALSNRNHIDRRDETFFYVFSAHT